MKTELAMIGDFLQQQYLLSLCATDGRDMWCANCFYLFDPLQMALWLMTEATTRHGALMVEHPVVVGTIALQTEEVALIQGIQYRGIIGRLTAEAEQRARERYCQRFPVAQGIASTLWQLDLQEIKMTDNRQRFGTKLHWVRPE